MDTIKGSARFLSPTQIQAGEEIIEAGTFIIAAGQRPGILDIEGKEHLKTSTDFLELDALPETITFIGAGYIAFELAAIANAAGSRVTIIHHGTRPLKGFDEDLATELVKAYQSKGISFVFNTDIQQVGKSGNQFTLTGKGYSAQTDGVICATGRVPNIEKLSLEKAGVRYEKQGILTNKFLQTSNPSIYACGDILSKKQPKLTPVSSFEGNYVAQCILQTAKTHIAYPAIPSIVYGSPKLAQVGVNPAQVKQNPEKFTVKEIDMTGWFNYRRINDPVAKAKLVYESGRLVGACAINSQADELINYLSIILEKQITHEEISQMILGSPTIASDLPSLL